MPKDKTNRSKPNSAPDRSKGQDSPPGQSAHEPPDDVTQAVESGDPEITGRKSGQHGETAESRRPADQSNDV
jgi:hypothetical protein